MRLPPACAAMLKVSMGAESPLRSRFKVEARLNDPSMAHLMRVIVSETGNQVVLDDDKDEVKVVHNGGPEIKVSGSEIVMTVGGCELKIGATDISLNNGLIKVGPAGVSLVNGAMTFGVPP